MKVSAVRAKAFGVGAASLCLIPLTIPVVGCESRGPTVRELRERYASHGAAMTEALGAVKATIELAPTPVVGAECTRPGMKLSAPRDRSSTDAPPDGNTEIISFERILYPLSASPSTEQERNNFRAANPLGADMALMPEGPVISTSEAFGAAGFLANAGDDDRRPDVAQEADRSKAITQVIVTRAAIPPLGAREHVVNVYVLEYPSAKLYCAFGVQAAADASLENERYETYNSRTGERIGGGVSDRVGDSARRNVVVALKTELQRRFQVALPEIVLR